MNASYAKNDLHTALGRHYGFKPKRARTRGFAAVAAIFLVVLLAALGGFMLTFSNTQQLTSAQDIQGSKAYWAARAGLEWGIGRVSAVASASGVAANTCNTVAPLTVNGFSVTVTCSGFGAPYVEAGVDTYIFQITSVATAGSHGTIGRIERSLSVSMERQ